ncbi:MAG: ATPase [Deinococcales bacterium]
MAEGRSGGATDPPLVVLVGLTGVGKSTAVGALRTAVPGTVLLPNRRELADRIVIPDAQRLAGEPVHPVRDRLQRFRLTARYREAHPGGLAHALERYLAREGGAVDAPLLLFDNLRGEAEVGYACERFPRARFIVLEAPAATRVLRLAGRHDVFDRAGSPRGAAADALLARLARVEGLDALLDLHTLAAEADGLDPEAVETGARVVAEESLHYDPGATWRRLDALPAARRIRLDTGRLSPRQVADRLRAWL